MVDCAYTQSFRNVENPAVSGHKKEDRVKNPIPAHDKILVLL